VHRKNEPYKVNNYLAWLYFIVEQWTRAFCCKTHKISYLKNKAMCFVE